MKHLAICPIGIAAALVWLALPGLAAPPDGAPAPDASVAAPADAPPADLTLGNEVVLRLRASAGGMTPQQRVSTVEGRLANVLGTPNIRPADVVVYTPAKGAPVIYALGRRLITVDAATVKAAGTPGEKPLVVATQWAKRFQQILPRVNYRPSNAPEPKVPANPPLLVTGDFAKVGGNKGFVVLRGKPILTLHGPQTGGLTAQERADALSARLERLAGKPEAQGPDGIHVQTVSSAPNPKSKAMGAVTLQVAQTPFVTVDPAEAKFAGTTPAKLAAQWAAHIRAALGFSDPNALPAVVNGAATPPVQAPVVVPPAVVAAPGNTTPAAPSVPSVTPSTAPPVPSVTPSVPVAPSTAMPTAPVPGSPTMPTAPVPGSPATPAAPAAPASGTPAP